MSEKAAYTPHSFVPTTLKPQVMGRRGVVAAGHPLVVEAGMRMLQKGGNAVDAGVATVFAAAVVEQASCGLGGEVPILIKLKGKPVVAVNGTGVAPELATASFYLNLPANDPRRGPFPVMIQGRRNGIIPAYGPLSAIVPGMIDGLLVALQEFGTMSFSAGDRAGHRAGAGISRRPAAGGHAAAARADVFEVEDVGTRVQAEGEGGGRGPRVVAAGAGEDPAVHGGGGEEGQAQEARGGD